MRYCSITGSKTYWDSLLNEGVPLLVQWAIPLGEGAARHDGTYGWPMGGYVYAPGSIEPIVLVYEHWNKLRWDRGCDYLARSFDHSLSYLTNGTEALQ